MPVQIKTAALSSATTSDVISGHLFPKGRIGLQVIISSGGDADYTVQHTLDGENWLNHDSLTAITESSDGNYAFPVAGIRLLINSISTGTCQLVANGY